jgi:hypothetical protein
VRCRSFGAVKNTGISLSSALLLSKVLLHYYYLLLYRLLFESLLLLDEPFYRTRERETAKTLSSAWSE